ncbi:hypothetical protein ESZ50_10315 [Weissella muntiaci]|uniref:Uncharacterized protein n=1 Tax=Weissella muntiaci TaxID=2508881 RepID=A0A6C2C3A6_9LACO|nr:hypothetical protein [Weissella muntiaci]TYC48013.1 hypothetical protein ESZ50_10315 [Weissella muntiaci]
MIGEYSVMNWVQLLGILGALGTIITVFITMSRDNKRLDKGIDELSTDHSKILNKQNDTEKFQIEHLTKIEGSISSINQDITDEKNKISLMNANEENARFSAKLLGKYVDDAQTNRLAAESETKRWEAKYYELAQRYDQLREELKQAQNLNVELSIEIKNLQPHHGPTLGGRSR